MNLRWLWFDHFPPDLALTAVDRAKARKMARAHWKREPRSYGAMRLYRQVMVPVGVLAILVLVAGIYWRKQLPVPALLPYFAVLYPGMMWALYRARRPFIRRALNNLGHPVCIGCGYLLHGISSERCPECGAAREPMPGKINP